MYGIKDLRVESVEKPKPSEDEVLLKIHAVGVCGSDIPRVNKKGPHVLPLTLGHEFAGEVIELGKNVENIHIGDKVAVAPLLPDYTDYWSKKGEYSLSEGYKYYGSRNDGAFAEYLAVKEKNCLVFSEDMPYDWGATVDPAANAIHAFLRAEATQEDSIAVYGLGAIGMFAVQYAKAIGMKQIIAIDIDDQKLAVAKESGATTIINSKNEDPVAKILELTDNHGVNVSLEMSGTSICQVQSVAAASKLGRVVYLGISNQDLTIPANVLDRILRYQISIKGSWNSFSAPFPGFEWTEAVKLMEEKKFRPDLLITHKYGLDDIPSVFKAIDETPFYFIKIMFYPFKDLK